MKKKVLINSVILIFAVGVLVYFTISHFEEIANINMQIEQASNEAKAHPNSDSKEQQNYKIISQTSKNQLDTQYKNLYVELGIVVIVTIGLLWVINKNS